jgi:hypothetical protein
LWRDRFGERGVVETVGLMGHFHTLTMLFVVDKISGAARPRRHQGADVGLCVADLFPDLVLRAYKGFILLLAQ